MDGSMNICDDVNDYKTDTFFIWQLTTSTAVTRE
jgi:hypothetical protein